MSDKKEGCQAGGYCASCELNKWMEAAINNGVNPIKIIACLASEAAMYSEYILEQSVEVSVEDFPTVSGIH